MHQGPEVTPYVERQIFSSSRASSNCASQRSAARQVPPHCIPIHANVTTYDWRRLIASTQFDVIMMDPPWQLATSNPTRGAPPAPYAHAHTLMRIRPKVAEHGMELVASAPISLALLGARLTCTGGLSLHMPAAAGGVRNRWRCCTGRRHPANNMHHTLDPVGSA